MRFNDLKKELEDDFKFGPEIRKHWESRKNQNRCYPFNILIGRILPE